MISLKREEKKQYSFAEALVDVRFRIPTAVEAEEILDPKNLPKDSEVFKRFVVEIKSSDVEGWEKGVDAVEVVDLPGTFSLVHVVAFDIVGTIRIDATQKK